MSEPLKTITEDNTIDFNAWYPHYDQWAAFGGPADDPDRSPHARTIKPLLDATHESLALIVSSVGSINAILQQLAAIIPSPASEGDSELARLQTTVERLSETFDLINPTKEEQ